MTTRMRQVSLNMGLLQLAINSPSVLVSHSTHQQEFQFTRLPIWTLKQKTKSLQRERERERERELKKDTTPIFRRQSDIRSYQTNHKLKVQNL